jgi:hypothetical protein
VGTVASFDCKDCLSGATCSENTSLATVKLLPGHWRLSETSEVVSKCEDVSDLNIQSPCKGGSDTSEYCREGHTGPLCKLCTEPKKYYLEGSCVSCPAVEGRVMLVLGPAVGASLFVLSAGYTMAHKNPIAYRWLVCWVNHFRMWLQNVAFMPKLKLVVGFFQSIALLPPVYGLSLPGWYYHWVSFLNIFESA